MPISKNKQLKNISLIDILLSLLIYTSTFLISLKTNSGDVSLWLVISIISYFTIINILYAILFKKVKKFITYILTIIISYITVFSAIFMVYFSNGIVENLLATITFVGIFFYPIFHIFNAIKNYLNN